jgi:hypothetical protein
MEKEFDFSAYGKVNPYKVPDGFFDDLPRQTLALAKKRATSRRRIILMTVASVSAAASVALFITWPLLTGHRVLPDRSIAVNNVPLPVISVADSSKTETKSVKNDSVKVVAVPQSTAKAPTLTQQTVAVTKKESLDDVLAQLSVDELMQVVDSGDDDFYIND